MKKAKKVKSLHDILKQQKGATYRLANLLPRLAQDDGVLNLSEKLRSKCMFDLNISRSTFHKSIKKLLHIGALITIPDMGTISHHTGKSSLYLINPVLFKNNIKCWNIYHRLGDVDRLVSEPIAFDDNGSPLTAKEVAITNSDYNVIYEFRINKDGYPIRFHKTHEDDLDEAGLYDFDEPTGAKWYEAFEIFTDTFGANYVDAEFVEECLSESELDLFMKYADFICDIHTKNFKAHYKINDINYLISISKSNVIEPQDYEIMEWGISA